MSSSDAASESNDAESGPDISNAAMSVMETVAPSIARRVGSGKFAAASGAISLIRAVQSFRKGDRKRGLVRALVGLFWIGVLLAQRRNGGPSGSELSEVVDTGPDIGGAVDPDERETDHATGEEVVNTTDADIDEPDTAPEVETSSDIDREIDDEDVDQREVAMTDEAESADSSAERGDAESEAGETGDAESETDTGDTETGTGSEAEEGIEEADEASEETDEET